MAEFSVMPDALRTPRLHLTSWVPADVSMLHALMAERPGPTPARSEVEPRIAARVAEVAACGLGFYGLRLDEHREMFGYCLMFPGFAGPDEPEIGYEIRRATWGNGYATEAATCVVDAAFATGRRRLWATTRPDNPASLRVLAKLGFVSDHAEIDDEGERLFLRLDR